jgi:hypothetical protein
LIGNAQGQQKAIWKGSTEVENGIKVVKNPHEPFYGEMKLEFEEELSIGRKNSAEYSFYLISDVKSDNQGNIYVADTKNLRVQKFDSNGKYIKTLGKGVVKFQQPSKIQIDNLSGSIFVRAFVLDIEIFDNKDQPKNGVHLKKNVIHDFKPIDDNHVMSILGIKNEKEQKYMRSLFRLGSDGEIKKISPDYIYNMVIEKIGEAIVSSDSGFELNLYLSKIDEKSFVYGYSKEYELNVIDKDGKVLYRIKKNEPRPIFTTEERKIFKHGPVPEFKPYFFNLLTDSKGRIYVQRNKTKGILNTVQENTNREVDIFSKDGYFLYKSTLPPNTCEIKNGFLYAYSVNEVNGLESVKRYRIKNWEKMGERIEH